MTWFYKCLEKSALEFLEVWALAPLPLTSLQKLVQEALCLSIEIHLKARYWVMYLVVGGAKVIVEFEKRFCPSYKQILQNINYFRVEN